MKIIAFAASNSSLSINRQLVAYTCQLFQNSELEILDLNNYEMPIYSADREAEYGIPELAKAFFAKLGSADALIISFAEHNGAYTAAFKNIFDWVSRYERKLYQDKPMLLLSTSPGPGGAKNVLATATSAAPHFGGKVIASISVPSFNDNFDSELLKVTNNEIDKEIREAVAQLQGTAP